MRAGINLCHMVHTVSPTYARDILRPGAGDEGGAGLEGDLQRVHGEHRLVGIINGCDYDLDPGAPPAFGDWPALMQRELLRWVGQSAQVSAAHLLALRRLDAWRARGAARPATIVTSVGRITGQKLALLAQPLADGREALAHVLEALGGEGLLVVLGSGDPVLEQLLTRYAGERDNLLFLRGYSELLSELLYRGGDLFLMPSSFEPCGISQMLAMRAGQPCLVHAVGGLADTVRDGVTGFSFGGASHPEQAEALLVRLREALVLHAKPAAWKALRQHAAAERFPWDAVASQYVEQLYQKP
jgi:starch synthase